MNTKINYFYRDSGNYKTYDFRIVAGEITKEQWDAIRRCCIPGDFYFYPEAVGFIDIGTNRWIDIVTDWCELENYELTDEAPDINMTVQELVQHFQEAYALWR